MLAVHNCLFNVFTATPPYLEAISSIHNPRTCHAVVIGTLLIWVFPCKNIKLVIGKTAETGAEIKRFFFIKM
jgi:hypothetical protein